MVSCKKASSILFVASFAAAHVASAHRMPKDFDPEKFAAKMKLIGLDLTAGVSQDVDWGNCNGRTVDPNPGKTAETFLDGHEFIAPGPGDVRSPCPFTNILANHGFINRSGKNVCLYDIARLSTTVFDLPFGAFFDAANMAIFDGQAVAQEDSEPLVDLDRLWDRPGQERDASQVFPNPGLMWTDENLALGDTFRGTGNVDTFQSFRRTIDEGLLQQLLDTNPGDVLTVDDLRAHLVNRILDSRKNDGFFQLGQRQLVDAAGQYVITVLLLGEDENDFSTVPKSYIEMLWREERLPDGFTPRSVRFGDSNLQTTALEQFISFRAANIAAAEEAMGKDLDPPSPAPRGKPGKPGKATRAPSRDAHVA